VVDCPFAAGIHPIAQIAVAAIFRLDDKGRTTDIKRQAGSLISVRSLDARDFRPDILLRRPLSLLTAVCARLALAISKIRPAAMHPLTIDLVMSRSSRKASPHHIMSNTRVEQQMVKPPSGAAIA